MAEPKYGSYLGCGSRYKVFPDLPSEAWVLNPERTKWEFISPFDHEVEAVELTKEKWEKRFPGAPPLPPDAFTD